MSVVHRWCIEPQRRRRSAPRTKTGCLVCRKRRVKCDEERPHCKCCKTSGWTCEYGNRSSSNNLQDEKDRYLSTAYLKELHISEYAIPFAVPGDQASRKALHHFCTQTAPGLSGKFRSEFWSTCVLRRCQYDSVVRLAATALSSAHLDFISAARIENDATIGCVSESTLKLYDKSVRKLRKYMEADRAPSRITVLMCCVCFVTFELIRAEPGLALDHLNRGIAILQNGAQAAADGGAEDLRLLGDVFERLDLQASLYVNDRILGVPLAPELQDDLNHHNDAAFVEVFQDVTAAQQSLMCILHSAMHYLIVAVPYRSRPWHEVPSSVLGMKASTQARLQHWSQSMSAYAAKNVPVKSGLSPCGPASSAVVLDTSAAIAELRLQHRVMETLVADTVMYPGPVQSFDQHAGAILGWARTALLPPKERSSGNSKHCFSLDIGVLAPVFLLALKTTDSSVLVEAVNLIRGSGLSEGFMKADALVKMIRHLEARCRGGNSESDGHVLEVPLEFHIEDTEAAYEGRAIGLGRLIHV